MVVSRQLIRVGHSPDPDDAFMFHALANGKVDTGAFEFEHELADIETLPRRAFAGELELTAVSLHAYAHLAGIYALCSCGASIGDGYGPIVVTRRRCTAKQLLGMNIAVPGTLTTAYLALRLCLDADFAHTVVPFDLILDAVVRGSYADRPIDAGLIIHEGQLTYANCDLQLAIDLGQWWRQQTDLPLPLGANAIRKDLGADTAVEVDRLLRASIQYGLDHRDEALEHALQFGRDLDRGQADRFVGMYVNDRTLDFGAEGRRAVAELLRRGHAAGIIPRPLAAEFVGG